MRRNTTCEPGLAEDEQRTNGLACAENSDQRRDELGLEGFEHLRRHNLHMIKTENDEPVSSEWTRGRRKNAPSQSSLRPPWER